MRSNTVVTVVTTLSATSEAQRPYAFGREARSDRKRNDSTVTLCPRMTLYPKITVGGAMDR